MANILKNTSAIVCEQFYLNEEFADVHFVFRVDDEIEKVPANKANLAVLSPVFKTMFYGSLPEKGDVQITDADIDEFKEFLQFFYLSNVTLTMENIETVVRLADKYDILEHFNDCAASLEDELTLDNMCWGYQLAVNLKNKELIDFCEDEIFGSPKEIFATDGFQRCDKKILTRILELDLTCNEAEVFDACLVWAKNACKKEGLDGTQSVNLRNQLGDCLKQIRFGVMKVDEFYQRHKLYEGLFTMEEIQDIMLLITVKEYEPKIFNKMPRLECHYTWDAGKILICQRKTREEPLWYTQRLNEWCIVALEVTSFSSNHPVLLGEIRTAVTFNKFTMINGTEIGVIITERENLTFDSSASPVIIYKGSTGTWGGEDNSQLMVTLPHPILIRSQRMYEIRLNIQSTGQGYYYSNYKQMVEIGDGIKIQFYRNPTLNYDNRTSGWLSELFFNKISN